MRTAELGGGAGEATGGMEAGGAESAGADAFGAKTSGAEIIGGGETSGTETIGDGETEGAGEMTGDGEVAVASSSAAGSFLLKWRPDLNSSSSF